MTTKITADNISANAITSAQISPASLPSILIAGNNITIEANGRISVSVQ
jgi:hypothetical protein